MLKMGIEVTDKMLGVYDVLEVRTEQASELLCEHSLANTFLATENDGDLTLTPRVLYGVRHPAEQIFRMLRVARADVLVQMRQIEIAVAGLGLAAEPRPQVELAVVFDVGRVHDRIELTTFLVIDPPFAHTDPLRVAVRARVLLFLFGVKGTKVRDRREHWHL